MSFRVEDALKAEPRSVVVVDARADKPVDRTVLLYTRDGQEDIPTPKIETSDPGAIRATLGKPASDAVDVRYNNVPRFELKVTIEPSPESPVVEGSVTVRLNDKAALRIPVQCTFIQNYRLSRSRVTVECIPGERTTQEVFYESYEPDWQDIEVQSAPPGVVASIRTFDSSTRVITLKIVVPEPGRARAGSNSAVVLVTKDRRHTIRIPVLVERKEG